MLRHPSLPYIKMLNCGSTASTTTENPAWSVESSIVHSLNTYLPLHQTPFEVTTSNPQGYSLAAELKSKRRTWAGVVKAMSLGLLLLGLGELVGLPMIPVKHGRWILLPLDLAISGLTVIAAGLGMRAAWRISSANAYCYMLYLVCFSGLFVIAEVLISMLTINFSILTKSSTSERVPSRGDIPALSAEILASRLMFGLLCLVLVTVCLCALLVYCASRLYQTTKACESDINSEARTVIFKASRESLD
jgi:hypothetical protein